MKLHETDRLFILSCYDFSSLKVHFFKTCFQHQQITFWEKRIQERESFEQNNTRQHHTTVSQSDYYALGWKLRWKVLWWIKRKFELKNIKKQLDLQYITALRALQDHLDYLVSWAFVDYQGTMVPRAHLALGPIPVFTRWNLALVWSRLGR